MKAKAISRTGAKIMEDEALHSDEANTRFPYSMLEKEPAMEISILAV